MFWALCLAMLCLAPQCLYALAGTPTLLLSTMDSQLEAVRQDIRSVKDELVEIKQDLAAAKKAKNAEQERKLFDLLLSLNNQLSGLHNQLSGLQEEKKILLRGQAPGKPCLQLVHTGLPVIILRSIQWKTRIGLYQLWMNYIPMIYLYPGHLDTHPCASFSRTSTCQQEPKSHRIYWHSISER